MRALVHLLQLSPVLLTLLPEAKQKALSAISISVAIFKTWLTQQFCHSITTTGFMCMFALPLILSACAEYVSWYIFNPNIQIVYR